ncbi:MAG: hypothetical protein ACPL4N_03735 [Candidatus Norongarragalinales archaeon]
MIAVIFKAIISLLENDSFIEASLLAGGFAVAIASAVLGVFTVTELLPLTGYVLLVTVLPVLFYRILVLLMLSSFDLLMARSPEKTLVINSNLEVARARITRVFIEKKLTTFSLSAYGLFSLGIEKRLLNWFNQLFHQNQPYVLFCKDPLVIIRLWQMASPDGRPQTRASIASQDEIRAKTLAKSIETLVKY